jgi:MFS family permease
LFPILSYGFIPPDRRLITFVLTRRGTGFDFGISGTATAFPAFQKEMGYPYVGASSGYLIQARYQVGWLGAAMAGDVIGVLLAGQLMDVIGRKHVIAMGCGFAACGVAMQMASHAWNLFLGGRLINGQIAVLRLWFSNMADIFLGIGFGLLLVQSPVWIGETARPELRGFFLCFTNGSIVFGQFLLASVRHSY